LREISLFHEKNQPHQGNPVTLFLLFLYEKHFLRRVGKVPISMPLITVCGKLIVISQNNLGIQIFRFHSLKEINKKKRIEIKPIVAANCKYGTALPKNSRKEDVGSLLPFIHFDAYKENCNFQFSIK